MDNRLKRPITAAWLAQVMGKRLHGPDSVIDNVRSIDNVGDRALVFSILPPTLAVACICTVIGPKEMVQGGVSVIESDNPRLDFALALSKLQAAIGFCDRDVPPKIHPSVKLGHNVVTENGVEIDEGTTICHNVVIGEGVKIGKNCLIKSGTVIGQQGFGFESDLNGTPVPLLHVGSVRIGDHVVLGALNTVARGMLEDTVVGDNVKTDDHVHIAHNVAIGPNTLIAACAEISGSVKIGKGVWIGPNVSITNKIEIGDCALIGIGAVITKSVAAGKIVAGKHAMVLRDRTPSE